MANNTGRGTFKKGDPRINRKGKPKSFDAVRELAQSISHEVAKSDGLPVLTDGHLVTVAEAILRQWAFSKNPQLQKAFIEYAFGKVPDKTELSGPDGGPIATRDDYTDAERAARIADILETAKKRNESSGS